MLKPHAVLGLAIFFLALLGNAWGQSQPPPRPGEAHQPPQAKPAYAGDSAQADQRGSEQRPFTVKAVPTKKTPEEAAQDQRDRDEKASSDWWNIRLTGALAIIGMLQLIVFGVQAYMLKKTIKTMQDASTQQSRDMEGSITTAKDATNVAERSLIASQRAWIWVDVKINDSLAVDDNGNITVPLLFTLTNTGNSPATNVKIHPMIVLRVPQHISPMQKYNEYCTVIRGFPPDFPAGYVLFPKETIYPPMSEMISSAEIQKTVEAWKAATKTTECGFISPHLIGCVSYTIPFDNIQHQTGFMRELRCQNPNPAEAFTLMIPLNRKEIASAKVIAFHSVLGSPSID